MARVSHPNVIAIHDVGQSDEQVYIAEEFVRGVELSGWLAAEPRSQQAILSVFLQAARGLAAAHAAGIIHRDFKPANVLVADDGRVRVADFGLARLAADGPEEAEPLPTPTSSPLHSSLTRTGTSMGTPFYMSPEQYQGKPSDARGDQFSFCVSLYEALYGARPFTASTYLELANKVVSGRIDPAPKADVPAALRAACLRGLRVDPEQRFPSMNELIRALEDDPRAGARRWLGLAAAGMAVLALLVLIDQRIRARRDLCNGARPALEAVWNPRRAAAAKAAFLATRLPFAAHLWSSVEPMLDAYGRDWAAMHTAACEATRLRGEQSDEVLDLRMLCLTQHLQELKAAADLFSSADRQVVEKAAQVASGLAPLSACADVEALKAPVPPPQDAATRARVDEIRGRIAQAKALDESGGYPAGLALAEGALESSAAIAYGPVKAEAQAMLGHLQARLRKDAPAQQSLESAFYAAVASRDDTAAMHTTLMLANQASELDRPADAHRWLRLDEALLGRSPDNPFERARLQWTLGNLLDAESRYDEARAQLQAAKAILEQLPGEQAGVARYEVRNDLGLVFWHQGNYPEAVAQISSAMEMEEKLLGPDHPDLADCHNNLGGILSEEGKQDEALVELRRALAIREKTLAADHPLIADEHENIGGAMVRKGAFDEALIELRLALAIRERALSPDHPLIVQARNAIGVALGARRASTRRWSSCASPSRSQTRRAARTTPGMPPCTSTSARSSASRGSSTRGWSSCGARRACRRRRWARTIRRWRARTTTSAASSTARGNWRRRWANSVSRWRRRRSRWARTTPRPR